MSLSTTSNNPLQFVTLAQLKAHFKITDTQDDDTLLQIVQAGNQEAKKYIIGVVDDLDAIEGSIIFEPCKDAVMVYCESEIRRQINQMYTEGDNIMEKFEYMMASVVKEIRSQAPERTSRQLAKRDTNFEDDFFAERRLP